MRLSSLRPRYYIKRLQQARFQRAYPDAPWLTASAILLLDNWLKKTDVGFEWGSGRSTIWFASRVSKVISIEENKAWFDIVTARLNENSIANRVDYRFVECGLREQDERSSHPYVDVVNEMADASLDFALVDGNLRLACLRSVQSKIKPGGLLILDNANRYVPNASLPILQTVNEPRSAPRSELWGQTLGDLKSWRWMNTTDGIWDTRFWVKPL